MSIDPGKIAGALETELIRLIPIVGNYIADMTPEQKQALLVLLAEAIARGAAQGIVQGAKEKGQ